MARFEKTHARRKHYCLLDQSENTLCLHEWDGKEEDRAGRLPMYQMFTDATSATRALQDLIAQRLDQGYEPIDTQAKEYVKGQNLTPAQPKKYDLPFRVDIEVENEANGFAIHNKKVMGNSIDDSSDKWMKAVNDGDLIPIELVQDDSFIIRVCAGGPLSEQEQEEWVGKVESVLHLPDGELCIGGGAEHIYGGDADVAISASKIHFVSMPPGSYKATVYMYIPGINGSACLDELAGGYERSEPPGKWFRRTRPGLEFPAWLRSWCIGGGGESTDPGHGRQWDGVPFIADADMPNYVGFLLHLEPTDKSAKPKGLKLNGGWFEMTAGARNIERCPLGLESTDPICHFSHERGMQGKWICPRETMPLVANLPLAPIQGGSVELPLSDLKLVFQLAQFCHIYVIPELQLANGSKIDPTGDWPEGIIVKIADGAARVLFDFDSGPGGFRQLMDQLSSRLSALPEGTMMELATANIDELRDDDSGYQRYRGKLSKGLWQIEETYPPLPHQTLLAALELARQAQTQDEITVANEAEGKVIIERARKCFPYHFQDNKPVLKGSALRMQTPEQSLLVLLAATVFFLRYKDYWQAYDQQALNDSDDDDDE